MQTKDTNPKDALGTGRAPISTVPLNVLLEVGNAMLEGARKYGRHNFRAAGVRHSIYIDAVFRHIAAHWEGEDVDQDSGLPHITKAIAALVVMRDSMMQGNDQDDRPPPSPRDTVKLQNELAQQVIAKTPDAVEPYTQVDLRGTVNPIEESEHTLPPAAFPKEGTTGHDVFTSVADDQGEVVS